MTQSNDIGTAPQAPPTGALPQRLQQLAWWLLSAVAVVVIPSFIRTHRPAWNLGTENEFQVLAAGMAILAAALAFESVGRSGSRTRQLVTALFLTLVAFGVAALLLTIADVPFSRLTIGISCVIAEVLVLARILPRKLHWSALLILLVVILAVCAAAINVQSKTRAEVAHTALPTEYYRISIDAYPVLSNDDVENSHGGAIASFGDLQLVATRRGDLYRVRQNPDGTLQIKSTGLHVPVAIEEFMKYSTYPTYGLRVTGLALTHVGDSTILYAAYDNWSRTDNCFTTRVSMVALSFAADQSLQLSGDWKPIFESKPCLKATTGYDAVQTGGKIVVRPDGGLLLSLGDHGINGLNGPTLSELRDNDYGKVIQLASDGSAPSIYTLGHRNPQGLAIGASGRIWETEHGPQGGDEINLLIAGSDYGWPSVCYGTDYGHFVWPYSPDAHDHGSFAEPLFAFVPSIGISNVIESQGTRFPAWNGDLLVASLKAETLYRVRVRDTHAVYSEPIEIGHRIRDMTTAASGDLLLWTDDGFVIRISPAAQSTVYDVCSGCHEPRGKMPALGPPLRKVIGRRIADHFEFGYSPALRKLEGNWTAERLDEFLRDPSAYAPGTTMTFRGIPDDAERAKVIEFLKEYE